MLSEACYYIAASNGLRDWLLQDWLMTTVDLEPYYSFFRAGGQLEPVQPRSSRPDRLETASIVESSILERVSSGPS